MRADASTCHARRRLRRAAFPCPVRAGASPAKRAQAPRTRRRRPPKPSRRAAPLSRAESASVRASPPRARDPARFRRRKLSSIQGGRTAGNRRIGRRWTLCCRVGTRTRSPTRRRRSSRRAAPGGRRRSTYAPDTTPTRSRARRRVPTHWRGVFPLRLARQVQRGKPSLPAETPHKAHRIDRVGIRPVICSRIAPNRAVGDGTFRFCTGTRPAHHPVPLRLSNLKDARVVSAARLVNPPQNDLVSLVFVAPAAHWHIVTVDDRIARCNRTGRHIDDAIERQRRDVFTRHGDRERCG